MLAGADTRPLRVCLEALPSTGRESGNDMSLVGLAAGLSQLEDSDDEYIFFTGGGTNPLLQHYMSGPCREFVLAPPRLGSWRRIVKRIPGATAVWRKVRSRRVNSAEPWLHHSGGRLERTGAEIVHFPRQHAFLTRLPSIYQPHDLQHVHYPEFFSKEEYESREVRYRAYCAQAKLVIAMTQWGKEDLMRSFGLPEEKIVVIPHAPLLTESPTESELQAAREKFRLPDSFVYYPAQTWAHKNHIGLVRALAALRDRENIRVELVCSGHKNEFFPQIEAEIAKLRIGDQVQFLGFVSPGEVHCLYALARCMVFPSKFEGWGLPLLEAGAAGTPVVCSGVRPLCDIVADAALLFEADDPADIANAIRRVWTDAGLREELARRGYRRASLFSWNKVARKFRAHYRALAGKKLREEDVALLKERPGV